MTFAAQPPGQHAADDIRVTAHTVTTCLGAGRRAHADALASGRSGLRPLDDRRVPFGCWVGEVAGLDELHLRAPADAFDNRATRLAIAALEADGFADKVVRACERWSRQRVGLVVGTSTSGVERLERAYRSRDDTAKLAADYSLQHHNDHHAVATFLQCWFEIEGPAYTISTACSSSAKAIVDAYQLVACDIVDAVVVAGIDSLCLTSLAGFEGLQLLARDPCRPTDASRAGISIGEGAAFLLVERSAARGLRLEGYGESSDATNMSTPPADGAGAVRAMQAALDDAGLTAADIDYVNLHGTATPTNDAAECQAVAELLGTAVPVSSLKGAIGHTLGAAGAVEATLCLIALEEALLPANTGVETPDPAIACTVVRRPTRAPLAHVLTNAFGFGGNNCVLVFGR